MTCVVRSTDRNESVPLPRPLLVGEKTESMLCFCLLQPGGGSFFAAAHAVTSLQGRMSAFGSPSIWVSIQQHTGSQRLSTSNNRNLRLSFCNSPRCQIKHFRRLVPAMIAVASMSGINT